MVGGTRSDVQDYKALVLRCNAETNQWEAVPSQDEPSDVSFGRPAGKGRYDFLAD